MLSVGFIVPTWHYFSNPFKLQPLTELYLATVVDSNYEKNGVDVSVIDLRKSRLGEGNYIPEKDIYFYWVAKSADYLEIESIVKRLRKTYPKAKHVAGGVHIEIFREECAKQFDALILGPGEASLIRIIEDFKKNALNKIYNDDWGCIQYEDYPIARRDYLPKSAIVNTELFEKDGGILGTTAMFSRGCNFKCGYCVYNIPHIIQRRSLSLIEKEIKYLKDVYKIKGISLRDEICVPLSQRIAIPFIETIGSMDVIWRGQTRVGASKEVIALAGKAGCVELAVGVESASQQVLDIMNKGQSLKLAKDFIYICKSNEIKIKMCLILGLPGEPQNIVDITKSFVDEVKPDYVNISGFCPVPGSETYNNPGAYGIRYIDNDWSKHAHLVYRFSDTEHFGLPFEYEKTNQWGKTFSRLEIVDNIIELQNYYRDCGMSY